jgi:hypothetical protein
MSPEPSDSVCPLCWRRAKLCLSHIIPAFAGRYLKETSATGYLRDGLNPNLRRQDIGKQQLLCTDCEQMFSRWENDFSQKAFPIVQADDFKELEYDSWLLKFVVSIQWRILVINHLEVASDSPQFKSAIVNTLENWRLFLLGERNQPGGVHHLFVFAGAPTKISGRVHEKTLHYFMRGIDATELVSSRELGVYSKMLRSVFYSPIVPASPTGWKNTRIHAGPGRIVSPQELGMPGFWSFIQHRITEVHAKPVSKKQLHKITEAMLANPQRTVASESFKVRQATRRLIGEAKPKWTPVTEPPQKGNVQAD